MHRFLANFPIFLSGTSKKKRLRESSENSSRSGDQKRMIKKMCLKVYMFELPKTWSYHANLTELLQGGQLFKADNLSGPVGVRFRHVLLWSARNN